jgi:hypothetical protein
MTCAYCGRRVKVTDLDFCRTCHAGICQRCRCLGNEIKMALGRCPVCDPQSIAAKMPKTATRRNEVRDKEE